MNCQIVLCPGYNDKEELERTVSDLTKLYPYVNSAAAVPVGITKHRDNLPTLEIFSFLILISYLQNHFLYLNKEQLQYS